MVICRTFALLPNQNPGQCWPHGLGAMFWFWCTWRQLFPDCISRLAFSRCDSWLGEVSLDHASDLATHRLTLFFTVSVGWRPIFHLSFVFVFMLSVSQLTAGLLCLLSLRWCVWPSRVWRTGWLLISCYRHRRITVYRIYVKGTVPGVHTHSRKLW